MKERFSPMVFAAAYAFFAPLALGVLANWAAMPAVVHGLFGQTAAAWLQAVGSVGAIWFAVGIGRRDRREVAVQRMEGLRGLMFSAVNLASDGFDYLQAPQPGQPNRFPEWIARRDMLVTLFKAVSAVELGSNAAPDIIMRTCSRLGLIGGWIDPSGHPETKAKRLAQTYDVKREISQDFDLVDSYVQGRAEKAAAWFWS